LTLCAEISKLANDGDASVLIYVENSLPNFPQPPITDIESETCEQPKSANE
jgi:hypothetical protein